MKRVSVASYNVEIFIGGDVDQAKAACRAFCDAWPECVTVTPTTYVFTGGSEEGVRIGFINYGRFPREGGVIFAKAEKLAAHLLDALEQETASIVGPSLTVWLSRRPEDLGE